MDDRDRIGAEGATADHVQETAAAARRPKAADLRIQRLDDLLAEAMGESDPLRASLRAAAADLLEIGYRLGTGIKATMGSASMGLEAYEAVMPAINSMALVHRQATRYVQLDRDQASSEDAGRGARIRRQNPGVDAGEMEV
jgi:hypothetical protein